MDNSLSASTSRLPLTRRRKSTFSQVLNGPDLDFDDFFSSDSDGSRRDSSRYRSLDNIILKLKALDVGQISVKQTLPDLPKMSRESLPPMSPRQVKCRPKEAFAPEDPDETEPVLRRKTTAKLPAQSPQESQHQVPLSDSKQQEERFQTESQPPHRGSLNPPPPVNAPHTVFLGMLNTEWDIYESKLDLRKFYYNASTGQSAWKPPRKSLMMLSQPPVFQSFFPMEKASQSRGPDRGKNQPMRLEIPSGYVEVYEKSNGFIYYYDPFNNLMWIGLFGVYRPSTLPHHRRVAFWMSAWGANQITPIQSLQTGVANPTCGTRPKVSRWEIRMTGWGECKGSFGQGPSKKNKNKGIARFLAIIEGHLLFFQDEEVFRSFALPKVAANIYYKSGCNAPPGDKTLANIQDTPGACVNLTHCKLSWGKLHKKYGYIELKSVIDTRGHDFRLRFESHAISEAWYQELTIYVAEVSRVTGTPKSNQKDLFKSAEAPSSFSSSVPGSPSFRGHNKGQRLSVQPLPTIQTAISYQPHLNLENRTTSPDPPPKEADSSGAKQKKESGGKLKREKSFLNTIRTMAEVRLRPKNGQNALQRTPSKRNTIKIISQLFSNESNRGQSREKLIKDGIIKREAVFGNLLSDVKTDPQSGLPEFVVRCIKRVEELVDTEGIYRINGDAAVVQKIRLDIDNDKYATLDSAKDASLLASALKLFFRELPELLIPREICEKLIPCVKSKDAPQMIKTIQGTIQRGGLDITSQRVLAHLMLHLNAVAANPHNRMDARNLAVVFTPNLVPSVSETRRPESIVSDIMMNYEVVRILIEHAQGIFSYIDK
eukprot:maker-scaffold1237_size53912-snap-gene-0.8 protein:Tk05231 transcript:maker-scaffold1237_size53912-snap-gene-0.8-mRNA-1 annotation:"rho gtpase-activating protein 12"